MAKESVEVELKAKAGNLQQTLEKMQKTLDKLSSGKHEMKIGTNTNDIIKALGNIDKKINSLSKNTNLKVTLGAGDTFAKLKNIDDKIKSINKNSKVNITASTGGTLTSAVAQADKLNKALSGVKSKSFSVKLSGADEAITKLKKIMSLLNSVKSKSININLNMSGKGKSSSNKDDIKEKYRTLASEAKSYALQAEKAWTMGDTGAFKSYRESFRLAMRDLADFKKSLGDMSIGKERNIYANMSRSIKQNTPLYDDVLNKVKQLNAEQKVFNAQTKLASASRESTARVSPSTMYAGLQTNAISMAGKYNLATAGSPEATKAKQDYEAALNALIRFKQAQGSISYSAMGSTYKSIAPKVEKDSAAYKLLQQRINEAKRATSELNGTQINTKSSSSNIMDTAEKLQYFIRLLGRSSKGVGSAGEAMSDALGKIGSGGGVFSKAAFGATAVTAVFAAIAAGAYMVVQSVMQVSSVLQAFGGALMTVLKPGYEVFESTTKNILSLSAALQTMGLIDGQTIQPFQAMSAAVNLTNQAMYRAQASAFSYKEVLQGLAGTLPLVLGKGGTAQQALDISTGVAGVAKLTGLNSNQVLQETRDLLQGTITARTSQVANVLGITNADIARYKGNIDGLFTFLQSKFNAYSQAVRAYTNTLPGSIEQLQESIGIAGQTVIDNFAPSITAVAQYITSLLGTWQDANGTIMSSNGQVTDSMGNVYSSIEEANAAGVQFDETTTSFQPSDTLNEFIQMLSDISDFLVLCADEVYNWAVANSYIDDQTPIFETLGNLIMICLAYVTDTTLAVIDFGTECVKWGTRIYNLLINPLIAGFELLGSEIAKIINSLFSMGKALAALAVGDTASLDRIKAEAEAYGKNELDYQKNLLYDVGKRALSPDTAIFSDTSTGYGGYRTKSKFSNMLEEAKAKGKFKTLEDWAEDAKKAGINPGAIRGVEKPDDKAAKKAAKEALQEAKRYYQEQQELLKNELEDIKEQIKKELDHVDALYSQGFLTVEDYYKQKTDLEAQQAKADIDYYNKLIDLTNQTPYEHETDRQKELLKLNRELQKATAKLGDIAENQKYIADLTEQGTSVYSSLAGGNQQSSATNPTSVQGVTGNTNEEIAYRMLTSPSGGFNDAYARGIIGSLEGESPGLNTTALGDKVNGVYTSFGVGQWHNERWDDLVQFAKDNRSDVNDIHTQISFLMHEILQGTQSDQWAKAVSWINQQGVSAENVTRAWTRFIERPRDIEGQSEARVQNIATVDAILAKANTTPQAQPQLQQIADNTAKSSSSLTNIDDSTLALYSTSTELQGEGTTWNRQSGVNMEDLSHRAKFMWNNMASWWEQHYGRPLIATSGYRGNGEHTGDAIDFRGYKDNVEDWNDDLLASSMEVRQAFRDYIQNVLHAGVGDEYAHTEYGGWHLHANASGKSWTDLTDNVGKGYYGGVDPQALIARSIANSANISPLTKPVIHAGTKEDVNARKAWQKQLEDIIDKNKEFAEIIGAGAVQEIQSIMIKYTDLIDQASSKSNDTTEIGRAYAKQASQLRKIEEVKIREIEEKYNKQYAEYKLKALEESAQQMADHLGMILEDGVDIFDKAQAKYTDISSAIKKYGQNYFVGAGAGGIDYNSKQISDYIKVLTTAGASDESIGYIKNFRDVKTAIDNYWASFAKSIKMMTDKVSTYFDHQASLIEGNKFTTTGQKEILKTRVTQQKAQALVSAGETTISQYEMAAGKMRADILTNEQARDALKQKIDSKKATEAEEASYKSLNSLISDYNDRLVNINNNLIPAIRNEIELNKQLAYMPTLLEQVGMTSKQSLEDGLLTFLTDSVNECKTLGEAFSTLIVGMLKDLQKLFAKKMINGLFGQWFGTGDRSQKSTAKESQFMQQQNPYTNFTNYQLAPTDWSVSYNNKNTKAPVNQYSFDKNAILGNTIPTNNYTFTAPQFRKMDAGIGDHVIVGQDSQDLTISFGNLKLSADALTATLESLKTSTTTFAGETTNKVTAATGGIISGAGTGTSDSIPAMLSNGEAVITAQRVRQLGAGAIHAINRGDFSTIKARIPHFATGGIVGDGAQNTARGMASFAGNIGANVSTTNQISIGLLRDDGAIIEDWMRSSKGQKHLLDFNRNHANVISKFK